ncbi:MAG: RNA polymerase sigma-70 factor [Chitinophagaceae bacterium]|nr:RNA polymerase sigma-70 factor [Chitinophagaceae bacterium]
MEVIKKDINDLFRRMASAGDESALWALHSGYFHKLFRFVFAFMGNKELTEEVVNDTFLGLWQKRYLLDNVANPEVYLFMCAKNKALKQLKKQDLYQQKLESLHDFECSIERTPHDILISSEIQRRINEAIQALPPQCKLIFSLVKENNLKYREVAKLLSLSEKTVENQMGIALKKLSHAIPLSFVS